MQKAHDMALLAVPLVTGYTVVRGLELITRGRLACQAELLERMRFTRDEAAALELRDELAIWQALEDAFVLAAARGVPVQPQAQAVRA
jgi:hypothetical protein